MRLIKTIIFVITIFLICILFYTNYNLYYSPELITSGSTQIDADLLKQLNYLEKSLDAGVAYEMQKQYPEGFFFSYLMYGLSWCELGADLNIESSIKKKAIKEAIKSLSSLESEHCKKSFTKNLTIPYGAFYFSWANYLRAKIISLDDNFLNRAKLIENLEISCDSISIAISNSKSPFLESYPHQFWPADILPGIASLSIHDKLFEPKYNTVIKNWFAKVDSASGIGIELFPHSVDSTGKAIQKERGSSFGLALIVLKEIPGNYTDGLIQRYIRAYSSDFLGLPMIREYSGNDQEIEDVDSGPIIFGNGSVATIVGAGVYKRFGMLDQAEKLNQTIESLGFPYEDSKSKRYLLGKFPMADFFIAWVKSLKTLEYRTVNTNTNQEWRLTFQIVSFIIISGLIVLLIKLSSRKRINKK